MKLRDKLFFTYVVPMGILCAVTYALEDVRDAVAEYIPKVIIIPIGLLFFFCFGGSIGLLVGLLLVPEAVLDEPGNRSDLKEILGVSGAVTVRAFCLFGLFWFLLAAYIVYDLAFVER